MKIYKELHEAIQETLSTMDESPEFKMKFPLLIKNFFENSYVDSDLNDAIAKVKFAEDSNDGN